MHLLVIEDERALCETIVRSLRRQAYSVDCCYDGEKALELLGVERYDLVLLDLNLPGKDGMTVLRTLRQTDLETKVLILSARGALLVPGIEAIYTWKDVDQQGRRYTQAGQTYPEPSPYDRLVIDRHVRFAGDVVAILAGKDEKCVDKAMKLIKVRYEVLPAVLDYHTALDNPVLVHPEENWESLAPVGADNKRNLCAHDESGAGDIEAVLAGCDVVIDHTYHTRACQQAMMETFRTYCSIDAYGRLNVLSC